MKITASDGKVYEVKRTPDNDRYDVWLEGGKVGAFVLGADDIQPIVHPPFQNKTTPALVREVADEFVNRGGAPMKMM